MTGGPDKSVARIKLVPVTSGMGALQMVSATNVKLVKLHRTAGGVVSRTITVRVTELELPLPSPAV